jgi:hypothetical protein
MATTVADGSWEVGHLPPGSRLDEAEFSAAAKPSNAPSSAGRAYPQGKEDDMESPRLGYTAELLRHFADLRDGTHGGASSRQDKERLFSAAVALLDPHARQPLEEINTDLLLGTGEMTATGVRRRRDGVDAIWAISWPEQQAAPHGLAEVSVVFGTWIRQARRLGCACRGRGS